MIGGAAQLMCGPYWNPQSVQYKLSKISGDLFWHIRMIILFVLKTLLKKRREFALAGDRDLPIYAAEY